MPRIATFDDWVDLFHVWKQDIELDPAIVGNYTFEAKFGELASPEIEFGAFAGEPKWERLRDVPDQRIRDALLNYVVYQADTEFASVEQQRNLIATAPSEYDLRAIARIMTEEMRHGWQMSYLLVNHFGSSGRVEAQKVLERRAFKKQRLLGAFNVEVKHWLDFFVYTEFQDRDGKYQLRMLSHSAFAPLARSMPPMLKEESFHLGTGHTGLKRIVRAGMVPTTLIQKYLYKWVPACYDLFGTDNSSSAQWGYVWGLKGRYDEGESSEPADREHLNETARALYIDECEKLLADINRHVAEGQPPLRLPDPRFNRAIGRYKGARYSVDGDELDEGAYLAHLAQILPSPSDDALVASLAQEPGWIAMREQGTGNREQ